MRSALWIAALGFGLWLALPAPANETQLARGASILAPFKRELMLALQQGMARGPLEAVSACQLRAPEIVEALSLNGVRVGRTSHKLRNPANRGPAWAAPLLAAYLDDSAARAPRSVELPDGRAGYVEPILVQPLCVTCHGTTLQPALAERIGELYPEDQATGFAVGDLRGVFWAEFPAR